MATTIPNGSKYMQAVTYTGTGATQTITVGFQPDLVWIKSRSAATDHKLTDSVRGVTKALISDTTGAETTDTNGVTAFTSTGFTLGSDSVYNTNAATYVAWCWQAGQGTSTSNTSGTITSTVSVNTTAGFSVVTYTGTGANATVGHGLGVAPSMIIIKRRNGVTDWAIYNSSIGNTKALFLNRDIAADTGVSYWNNTSPTSTLFTVGYGADVNPSSGTMVAYCFAEIAGFSKFTTYVGNGSTDGPFVYTGFRPKYVMWKRTDTAGFDWDMYDSSRDTYNLAFKELIANSSAAESTSTVLSLDILSNGFKLRTSNGNGNASGGTYIYMAFAESPFSSNNRAR